MASVYNMRPLPNDYVLDHGEAILSRMMEEPAEFAGNLLNSYKDIDDSR